MPSLAGRLQRSHRRNFVGRETEITLFEQALNAGEPPFVLMHISGPGGVGKTSLLRQFELIAAAAGLLAVYVNGESISATPGDFIDQLRRALPSAAGDPIPYLAALEARHVLLVDSFESLAPLQRWLREQLLPQLSDQLIVVIADRNPLTPRWRYHPAWQPLIMTRSLRNLPPDSARAYLAQHAVPPAQHDNIIRYTYGHPLGLALIADLFAQRPDAELETLDNPDIVKALLQRFVADVPGPAHRAALDVAGLARVTSEALLAAVLDMPNVHALFEWLRDLSFIETHAEGVVPHGLAREALASDLKWRNPSWHRDLKDRLRNFYRSQLTQVDAGAQQEVLINYIYLHRDNQIVRPFFERLQQVGGIGASLGRPTDDEWPQLVAMVARHEGARAGAIAQRWFDAQPHNVQIFRDENDAIVGLMSWIDIADADEALLASDPATQAAVAYLRDHAPLRAGEQALYFRFWLHATDYQSISAVQALVFVAAVRRYLTTPNLAVSFFACADATFWTPIFTYADLPPLPPAMFEVDGRHYGVFSHDWRAVPPTAWLELLAGREGLQQPLAANAPVDKQTVLVLSKAAFGEALRDALNDLPHDDRLAQNPLLRSRLILQAAGSGATVTARCGALRQQIETALADLQADARSVKYYRAFYHTYLQPAATQEAAAELIDVPFGSFRRHLKRAVEHVTAALWQQELG